MWKYNMSLIMHNVDHECIQYTQVLGNCYTIIIITIIVTCNELVVWKCYNSGLKSMKSLASIPVFIVILSSTVSAAGNSKV